MNCRFGWHLTDDASQENLDKANAELYEIDYDIPEIKLYVDDVYYRSPVISVKDICNILTKNNLNGRLYLISDAYVTQIEDISIYFGSLFENINRDICHLYFKMSIMTYNDLTFLINHCAKARNTKILE